MCYKWINQKAETPSFVLYFSHRNLVQTKRRLCYGYYNTERAVSALIQYADKYGVTKAVIKYKTIRQYIYRWERRYDGFAPSNCLVNSKVFGMEALEFRGTKYLFLSHVCRASGESLLFP